MLSDLRWIYSYGAGSWHWIQCVHIMCGTHGLFWLLLSLHTVNLHVFSSHTDGGWRIKGRRSVSASRRCALLCYLNDKCDEHVVLSCIVRDVLRSVKTFILTSTDAVKGTSHSTTVGNVMKYKHCSALWQVHFNSLTPEDRRRPSRRNRLVRLVSVTRTGSACGQSYSSHHLSRCLQLCGCSHLLSFPRGIALSLKKRVVILPWIWIHTQQLDCYLGATWLLLGDRLFVVDNRTGVGVS